MKDAITISDSRPVRDVGDERLDFNSGAPLRQAYLVASSPRCGSTYFCYLLWKTGVLGAPSEVLNTAVKQFRMGMTRFRVSTPAEYIAKLIERRTSKNGVFGMKAHFPHFENFLENYPALLEVLSPMTYMYIYRNDKVAQAVSNAKALQTSQWSSRVAGSNSIPPLRYDRDLIAQSMREIELKDAGWLRWFETQGITPFRVSYESLTADPDGVVGSVMELLGVQNDEPSEVNALEVEKQSDDTNLEWIERFKREAGLPGGVLIEVENAAPGPEGDSHQGPEDRSQDGSRGAHFFDRSEQTLKDLPIRRASPTGFLDLIRLRRRYDAIIAQNRDLFHNARVLVMISFAGFWSLAALDAGAASVTTVETSRSRIRAAQNNLRKHSVKSESHQFINSKISSALQTFNPKQFDVVLCGEGRLFDSCGFVEFFFQLSRLLPKCVILDTQVAAPDAPMAHFSVAASAWKGRGEISATPNHGLIAFLCDSTFSWRLVDWHAMGITDWAGAPDYARGERRTYVLEHPAHFIDRKRSLIQQLQNRDGSSMSAADVLRLRRRYDAVIAENRELLRDASALVIISFDGFWTLAALEAGAAHVVAVETSSETVKAAKRNLRGYAVESTSYEFIQSKITEALQSFNPEEFDVIICAGGFFEYCHLPEFFGHLARLRPKHVILDTPIAPDQEPLAEFSSGGTWKDGQPKITATVNHGLIAFMCESVFRWRTIGWDAMVTDWKGAEDDAADRYRTYVLERL
jgi:trehalose 2-sulfotransferase